MLGEDVGQSTIESFYVFRVQVSFRNVALVAGDDEEKSSVF